MSKNRYAVTCNGRPAFYASMYEDIRTCAMELGWSVALHGSLKSDMDIMAMPWVENAVKFETLVSAMCGLFEGNELAGQYSVDYKSKPNGRVVATIPIWEDFYLDISTIDARKPMERIVERLEEFNEGTFIRANGRANGKTLAYGYSKGIEKAVMIVKEEGGINE